MAQTEQFMLRMGTYGPDLLDDRARCRSTAAGQGGHHPEVRGLLRQGGGDRRAAASPGRVSRDGGGLRHRCLGHRRATPPRLWSPARSPTATRRQAAAGEPSPFRHRGQPGEDPRRVARRRLHPGDGSRNDRHREPQLVRPPRRRPRRHRGPDPGRRGRPPIADLDPTDRRFRVYNQAAEVLLDPDRRAAYDAELAGGRASPADEPRRARPTAEGERRCPVGSCPAGAGWPSRPSTALAVARLRRPWPRGPSDASIADATRAAAEQRRARHRADPVLQRGAPRRGPAGRGGLT